MPSDHTDDAELVRRLRRQRYAECIGEPCARWVDAVDAADRIEAQAAEIADLKISVVSFAAPYAAMYAKEMGLPPGTLHGTHWDILKNAGARMDDFTRAVEDGNG